MAGGRGLRWCLSPACLLLAVAVALAMPGLAAARTRRYTFNVSQSLTVSPYLRHASLCNPATGKLIGSSRK